MSTVLLTITFDYALSADELTDSPLSSVRIGNSSIQSLVLAFLLYFVKFLNIDVSVAV